MRTQLTSLAVVQATFEERSEDGRLNCTPVQLRDFQELVDIRLFQLERVVVVEQAAIEPIDHFGAETAAAPHGREQIFCHGLELPRVAARSLQQALENAGWKDVDVLREHAEQHLDHEVGDSKGLVLPVAEALSQLRELPGRRFSQLFPAHLGPEVLRLAEGPLQQAPFVGKYEVVERDRVDHLNCICEVRADHDPVHVGDDQQRRILQIVDIVLQLRIGRNEVFVLPFILPAKTSLLPHVGKSIPAAGLCGSVVEAVRIPLAVDLSGRRLSQQAAEIDKVLLRSLALPKLRGAPFVDEFLWGHGHPKEL